MYREFFDSNLHSSQFKQQPHLPFDTHGEQFLFQHQFSVFKYKVHFYGENYYSYPNIVLWQAPIPIQVQKNAYGHITCSLHPCVNLRFAMVVNLRDVSILQIHPVEKTVSRLIHHSSKHSGTITCLLALPDGYLVSGSDDCTLKMWFPIPISNRTKRVLFLGHTRGVTCVDLLPNGCVISGSTDKTLRVWDINNGVCMYKTYYNAI